MEDHARVFVAWRRVGAVALLSVAFLLTLAWTEDPASGATLRTVLVAATAAELVLLVRAARRGVVVDKDALISRDWLRTRIFPIASVTYVGTAPYEQITTPGVAQPFVHVVIIEASGRRYDLRQLRGLKTTARGRADRLRLALNLAMPDRARNDAAGR